MQKAAVADFLHAIGQDMLEAPAEQRDDVQGCGAEACTAHVPGGAGDRVVLEADEAWVGDGDREAIGGKGGEGGMAAVLGLRVDGPGDGPDLGSARLQETGLAHVGFAQSAGDG
jgi:hypothetical protein